MYMKMLVAVLLVVSVLAGCASANDSYSGRSSGGSSSGHSH